MPKRTRLRSTPAIRRVLRKSWEHYPSRRDAVLLFIELHKSLQADLKDPLACSGTFFRHAQWLLVTVNCNASQCMTLSERKVVSPQRARCCSRFSLLLTTSQPLPLKVGPACHVSAEPRPSFFTVAPRRPCTYPAEPFSNRTSQKKGRKTFFARFTVSPVSASLFTPLSSSKACLLPCFNLRIKRGTGCRTAFGTGCGTAFGTGCGTTAGTGSRTVKGTGCMVQAAGTVRGTGCGTASGTTFRSRYQSAIGLGVPQPVQQTVPAVVQHVVPAVAHSRYHSWYRLRKLVPSAVPQPVPHAVPQPVPSAVRQPVPNAVPQPVTHAAPQRVPSVEPAAERQGPSRSGTGCKTWYQRRNHSRYHVRYRLPVPDNRYPLRFCSRYQLWYRSRYQMWYCSRYQLRYRSLYPLRYHCRYPGGTTAGTVCGTGCGTWYHMRYHSRDHSRYRLPVPYSRYPLRFCSRYHVVLQPVPAVVPQPVPHAVP